MNNDIQLLFVVFSELSNKCIICIWLLGDQRLSHLHDIGRKQDIILLRKNLPFHDKFRLKRNEEKKSFFVFRQCLIGSRKLRGKIEERIKNWYRSRRICHWNIVKIKTHVRY